MDLLEEVVVHVRTIGVTRNVRRARRMDIARKAKTSEQIARELAGFVQGAKIICTNPMSKSNFSITKSALFIIIYNNLKILLIFAQI